MKNILNYESQIYSVKTNDFEGPLDLLCHLIDKNKMNICDIDISNITDQYIQYLNAMEELDLEIASEISIVDELKSVCASVVNEQFVTSGDEEEEKSNL